MLLPLRMAQGQECFTDWSLRYALMHDFVFKPFEDMTAEHYAAVGFKSGLEIHQQLLTSRKLFCRCPARRYREEHDAEILRHMRPTLSELGEYDGTALMEFKTRKDIVYLIHHESVCTYEMDDTPPFELNEEALDIALGIGLLYGCSMVDEIHIARKQYLDGSIPTGFQRTTIVGVDGSIPYEDRAIRIVQLGLEEDSCREVSDAGHLRTYRTDRLGMPLIETVTAPDMRTPQEVAQVAEILRRLVRSTGKVRTGIGAARQDVNVSVSGGTRIEIKGVPRIPAIPLLTYNEAMRQWNLLRLRDELHRRGIREATFRSDARDVTRLLRKTRYLPIKTTIAEGGVVSAVLLRGFGGLLGWQTQTDTAFSQEISDRVRVIACLTTLPNIIHSDSPSETISSSDWRAVQKAVEASDADTVVLVWGKAQDVETGAKEIAIRAREAAIGVPSETRQAFRDGTNGFERILPGPDRMYPDTDLPPKRIPGERLARIGQEMPEHVWVREQWYRDLGLPADVILPLAVSAFAELFRECVNHGGLDPTLAAVALVQYTKHLRRKGRAVDRIAPEAMREIFKACREGRLFREGILPLMEEAAAKGRFSGADLPPVCSEEELAQALERSLAELGTMRFSNGRKRRDSMMGLVMRPLRGRIAGAEVARRVDEALGEAVE